MNGDGYVMDRGAGVALWRQIAERLKADIRAGVWAEDEKLPAENDLAGRFGVNRHTIRRAVAELSAQGLLRARQGHGTFVASAPISYPINERTRFSEIVSAQAREPGGRLIASTQEIAPPWLVEKMGLSAGEPVHRLETLHVADGIPVSLSTSWFPARRFPGLVSRYAETGSVTKALVGEGLTDYRRKRTDVSARPAEADEARWLQLSPDAPVLVTDVTNVDAEGRTIQVARTRFAADRIVLNIET